MGRVPPAALTVALLLVPPAAGLRAADLESLHALNVNLEVRPGWTLQLHGRVRTFEDVSALQQYRFGPVLWVEAAPRATVFAAYYRIGKNTGDNREFEAVHRPWSAVKFRVLDAKGFTLDSRSMAERHISGSFDDYWRFRNRAWLARRTPFGEVYGSAEALREQGVWYGRYMTGVEWQLHERFTFAVGYEFRDAADGSRSHVVGTYFEWDAWRRPASAAGIK